MKVLVIGGSGFIGKHICLGINADEIAYYSRSRSPDLEARHIKWIPGSVLEQEKVAMNIEKYDTIIDAAGVWDETQQKHMDINVQGVKNIVSAIKTFDKDQRLIYISAINVDYGSDEYFRTRRIAEGNVNLVKNSAVVRPSVVFGNGSRIMDDLVRIAKSDLKKLPNTGNLAPVYVEDLVTVLNKTMDFRGSMNVCSKDAISLVDAVNAIRSEIGSMPVRGLDMNPKKVNRFLDKISEKLPVPKERINMLLLNYFRENTSLPRYVDNPVTFRGFVEQYIKNSDLLQA